MGPPLRTKEGHAVIDQADMYAHVFLPLDDDKVRLKCLVRAHTQTFTDHTCFLFHCAPQTTTNSKYFIAVVTEYIRSLGYYHMPIEVQCSPRAHTR